METRTGRIDYKTCLDSVATSGASRKFVAVWRLQILAWLRPRTSM